MMNFNTRIRFSEGERIKAHAYPEMEPMALLVSSLSGTLCLVFRSLEQVEQFRAEVNAFADRMTANYGGEK